jgi:hypothetical protein
VSGLEIKDLFAAAETAAAPLPYDPNEARAEYIKRMEAEGCRVVFPSDDELQVDIDTDEHYAAFLKSWAIFERDVELFYVEKPTYVERPSRSGLPSRHITVKLPFDVTSEQRIAWQAALGSDPVRELLSMLRDMRGDEHPTLFVEAK